MDLGEIIERDVPRETLGKLFAYRELVETEASKQNLISKLSICEFWDRHILDSAQLLRYAGPGDWGDIGSGAGLPGVVLAILSGYPIVLIEPRRLRADFLQAVVSQLGLANATVVRGKASASNAAFDVITARAVAPVGRFFALAHHLSRPNTVWILPKGRGAQKELDEARVTWQGEFRLEPSLTDADASILVATGVRRRAQ